MNATVDDVLSERSCFGGQQPLSHTTREVEDVSTMEERLTPRPKLLEVLTKKKKVKLSVLQSPDREYLPDDNMTLAVKALSP